MHNDSWSDTAVELLAEAGSRGQVRVRGQSMRPTLEPGQQLEIDFTPRTARCGDLILFRQEGSLLVHRCLGPARSRGLRSRGDGAEALDPAVEPTRILGRVVAIRDGERWRSTIAPAAAGYARAVAWHALFWSAMAIPARAVDRGLSRLCPPGPARRMVLWLDRGLLLAVHRLLFRAMHPIVPPPPDREETDGR